MKMQHIIILNQIVDMIIAIESRDQSRFSRLQILSKGALHSIYFWSLCMFPGIELMTFALLMLDQLNSKHKYILCRTQIRVLKNSRMLKCIRFWALLADMSLQTGQFERVYWPVLASRYKVVSRALKTEMLEWLPGDRQKQPKQTGSFVMKMECENKFLSERNTMSVCMRGVTAMSSNIHVIRHSVAHGFSQIHLSTQLSRLSCHICQSLWHFWLRILTVITLLEAIKYSTKVTVILLIY